MAEFKFQVCILVVFVLLPDEANEVSENWRLKPWPPSLRDICRRKDDVSSTIFGIIHSFWAQVFIFDKCKFYSYSDMSRRFGIFHHISGHSTLAVTWNLGLCTTWILYHFHFPKHRQTEYFNVLYVNVLTLSSAFSHLKFKEKMSLFFKEKCQIYIPRILLPNSKKYLICNYFSF